MTNNHFYIEKDGVSTLAVVIDSSDLIKVHDSMKSIGQYGNIDCVVTSPPYFGLRDYQAESQIGNEKTVESYIENLCKTFDAIHPLLKSTGTLFVNIGDVYSKQKQLLNIPAIFSIEMQKRGWILRNKIIWHKPNCMPQSVKDRFTVDFEEVFFFVKSKKYYFNADAVKEDAIWKDDRRAGLGRIHYQGKKRDGKIGTGQENFAHIVDKRNKRCVWKVATRPFSDAHFATYPKELIEPMILAGCPRGGVVLDPFFGSGTTGIVANNNAMHCIGFEINQEYINIISNRLLNNK